MKKILCLVLCATVVFCFNACLKQGEEVSPGGTEPGEEAVASSAYYDYAVEHHDELMEINKDWRDDEEYYYLIDADHDGEKELVAKIGCGVGIYKEINGVVEEVFYDRLPDSPGSVNYWVAAYDGKDYIVYTSASSSEYRVLSVLKDGKLEEFRKSLIIDFTDYEINGELVSQDEYEEYVESIEYPSGMSVEGLK